MIAFVVAMEKEAKDFFSKLNIKDEKIIAGKKVVLANYLNKEIVVGVAGIGKVNAGLTTQMLIDNFNPELVINFGLAGGKLGCGLNAGDVVFVEKACQYDFDLSELDDVEIGYMQDYDTIYYNLEKDVCVEGSTFVKCATGDRFTSKEYFLEVIKNLGAQISDMELGAIAQVCVANNVKLISLKLISDVEGKEGSIFEQYYGNLNYVSKLADEVVKMLNNL